jgi:RP/EB family microtubule-associated protein
MKPAALSRIELLQWINQFTECDYPKVEMLCDGIAYCQVLDAVHPNCVNLAKFNLSARFPDEFALNLKTLNEVFKKLRLDKIVPVEKLSRGKFLDNITFLQWLFNYAARAGPFVQNGYSGYERRLEALHR